MKRADGYWYLWRLLVDQVHHVRGRSIRAELGEDMVTVGPERPGSLSAEIVRSAWAGLGVLRRAIFGGRGHG